jgi:hypothetical protein
MDGLKDDELEMPNLSSLPYDLLLQIVQHLDSVWDVWHLREVS